MKLIRLFAWISSLIMTFMIIFSLLTGNFFEQGSILMGLVWGQMSLVDLYVGFFLVYLWIYYKESKLLPKIIWAILLIVTGSLATAVYVLIESYRTSNINELLTNRK
ncbi:MAG TPA: DUF1475 family protein [Erysipelotrichaceae bacterium]|nr:DUF1475 family protein [Erysipelotrichaceae bacterium]